jgi:ectoine hydroxylase-related dioxygenase (phytanoyl-CoA dioxygenase family)
MTMSKSSEVKRYGVKVQTAEGDAVGRAAEHIQLVGYAVVDGGYSGPEQAEIAAAFDRARDRQAAAHGGVAALTAIDEHNTIRLPLALDPAFLALAQNKAVLGLAGRLFGGGHAQGSFMLNQQNGISNPGHSGTYNQGAFHRDLPYQHFVSSRPLAINALYCIEPFTAENGATLVVPGSHKQEAFPSDHTVRALSRQVEAPPGHFLVLDAMLYHSGGVNRTAAVRRAVNHVYTLPFIRQQIEIPGVLGPRPDLAPDVRRLLGYGNEAVHTVAAYYAGRRAKNGSRA